MERPPNTAFRFGPTSNAPMKPPVFRAPTRDARDADHMAIIAVLGGIYLWWRHAGLPASTAPWVVAIAIASVVCGVLLWLRAPAIKWLGVLVFVAICGLGVRRFVLDGFSLSVTIGIVLPVVCAVWMARIDYAHKFVDEDEV
jgi:hypothetical protein